VLAVGFGGFAIFGILTTILNSLGHERASAIVTGVAAALVAAACFIWVRGTPLSDELLFRTATATSTSIGLATVTAGFLVHRAAGGLVPARVVLRVGAATLAATTLGRFLSNAPTWLAPALALAVVAVYAGILVATRELGADDLALVKRVLKRSA
jgi:stage V sporulation protein B